ncbi:MAG: hypothetical protein H0V93_12830 [Euzebyales bacterium]|nr:hypothetical protein [Euzebyales bacterium]
MQVDAWDSVFIRARRAEVHAVLADPASYADWWPGLQVAVRGDLLLVTHPPRLRLGLPHRTAVRVMKVRPELGIDFAYAGDLDGEAEFYYLDEVDGTVVTYLLRATTGHRRWRALLADHRASVRVALHELKDRLEGARLPGTEPDPRLLADQREAALRFRAGVEAHARKLASARGADSRSQSGTE